MSLRPLLASRTLISRVRCIALTLVGLLVSGAVLAQECPLTSPLTVKDIQDGFAGQTGTVWTIAPDCSFTVAHQIGTKIGDPIKEGHLTSQQETQLKAQLARTAIADMPAQLGNGPKVNARSITLSYAGRISVLTLPPGDGDVSALRAATADDLTGRLLGLAEIVKGITGT
jgi:hypothetical protein